MKKENDGFVSPADLAWENFEKTGNISYYLLYKQLTDKR